MINTNRIARGLLLIMLLPVLVFSCNENSEDAEGVAGNWYKVDEDSTYYELYFNDGRAIHYNEDLGAGKMYRYRIVQDTLKIYYQDSLESEIQFSNQGRILILDKSSRQDTFYRLDEDFDYFSMPNTMRAVEDFDYEFQKRRHQYNPYLK